MDDIFQFNKLLLAVLFLIPGFVCAKVYATCAGMASPDAGKSLVEALAFSCLTYGLASPFIYLAIHYQWTEITWAAFFLWPALLFVLPAALAIFWVKARKWRCLQNFMPHPIGKAWDFVFGQRRCYYVIVTLKSGRRIGGVYGESSFTSSGLSEEQIYIETIWEIDEEQGFLNRRDHSCGILISHDRIETIEFIWPDNVEQQNNEESSEAQGNSPAEGVATDH